MTFLTNLNKNTTSKLKKSFRQTSMKPYRAKRLRHSTRTRLRAWLKRSRLPSNSEVSEVEAKPSATAAAGSLCLLVHWTMRRSWIWISLLIKWALEPIASNKILLSSLTKMSKTCFLYSKPKIFKVPNPEIQLLPQQVAKIIIK